MLKIWLPKAGYPLEFASRIFRKCRLEPDEEKWNLVFRINRATTENLKWTDVSFKHHPA
jgi:hypothetical protein